MGGGGEEGNKSKSEGGGGKKEGGTGKCDVSMIKGNVERNEKNSEAEATKCQKGGETGPKEINLPGCTSGVSENKAKEKAKGGKNGGGGGGDVQGGGRVVCCGGSGGGGGVFVVFGVKERNVCGLCLVVVRVEKKKKKKKK